MEKIVFEVKGSALKPYKVVFVRRSISNISAFCTCPAGEYGQYCKHRFTILEGELKGLVNPNLNDVETIQSWLIGTDVEKYLLKMRELEKAAKKIKSELSSTKKNLAKALHD
ncbi:MAG: SWIM zinc finger family protein [Formosimonas sp.]